MLYAFLGSTLLGALSTVYLLWRKSVVEKKLAVCQSEKKTAQDSANRALTELTDRQEVFSDQLQRQRDQIETLRIQRDAALTALAKSNSPGSIAELIRLRALQKP